MPEFKIEDPQSLAVIKVFGIGGAGGAAINRMKSSGLAGVSYVAVNTDAQALAHSEADEKIHIGRDTTRGLGAGADPTVGRLVPRRCGYDLYSCWTGRWDGLRSFWSSGKYSSRDGHSSSWCCHKAV